MTPEDLLRLFGAHLETRVDYLRDNAPYRRRFEGWLQVEILRVLKRLVGEGVLDDAEPERERIDLWFRRGAAEFWMQLKVVPTNYAVPGIPHRTVNITDSVTACREDAEALAHRPEGRGLLLVLAYPFRQGDLPAAPAQWSGHHLSRIREGGLSHLAIGAIGIEGWDVGLHLFHNVEPGGSA